jgi:hypothetical protein
MILGVVALILGAIGYLTGWQRGADWQGQQDRAALKWVEDFERRKAALKLPHVGEDEKLDTIEEVQAEMDALRMALHECEGAPKSR